MTSSQESAIIDEVLEGKQDSYAILVERYHRGLIGHLYMLVKDEDLAEDLAQEAFIRAYDKLHQYNPSYAFSTWLYRIADNMAYKQIKQFKPSVDITEMEDKLPDDRLSPHEIAILTDNKERVRQAIGSLPASYQQVISLYYWDNFNYEEIARITDRPVGTIRTWLHRAKEQLRKELYGQIG